MNPIIFRYENIRQKGIDFPDGKLSTMNQCSKFGFRKTALARESYFYSIYIYSMKNHNKSF